MPFALGQPFVCELLLPLLPLLWLRPRLVFLERGLDLP